MNSDLQPEAQVIYQACDWHLRRVCVTGWGQEGSLAGLSPPCVGSDAVSSVRIELNFKTLSSCRKLLGMRKSLHIFDDQKYIRNVFKK